VLAVNDFDIDLGTTRTVDHPEDLAKALTRCETPGTRPGENEPGATVPGTRKPLTFAEFSRLLSSGSLTRLPTESDPFIYRADPELAKNDSEIRAGTSIAPEDFRRLRRGFLFKQARDLAIDQIEHEKEILTHSRPVAQAGTPSHSDYVAYLATFHKTTLEAFFRPWALPVSSHALKAHSYIAAASRHGKSELIKVMLYGLLKQGQGAIIFDPHGDFAEELVRWREFAEDPSRLIYFYPYLAGLDLTTVPTLNPLAPLYKSAQMDSAVENFIGTMSSIVGGDDEVSRRMKMLLKPCLYSLAQSPNATLYDLIDFMAERDKGDTKNPLPTPLVDRAKKQLTNRSLLDTLETFFDRTYDTTKSSIRDRLRTLLSSNALDRCLGGASTIDLAKAMDSGKFIVFNLSAGMLGDDTSDSFGRFLIASIQNIAMQRQAQEKGDRRPVFMFLDEADRFMTESIPTIYKQTAKYGLHLSIVQQITGYGMSDQMQRAVFGNSFVRIAGNSGGDETTAKDLHNMTGVERDELKNLKRGMFYAKIGPTPARLFSVPSFLADNKNAMTPEQWEEVKAYQLAHYYRPYSEEKRAGLGVDPANDQKTQETPANEADTPFFN
jgi:hypothetical protein